MEEKKRSKKIVVLLLLLVSLLFAGTALVFFIVSAPKNEKETVSEVESIRTFADWTDVELFQNVPALIPEDGQVGKVNQTGGNCYVINIQGCQSEDYQSYLKILKQAGYDLYADNGEKGLNGNVFSATYKKGNLVLTAVHMEKTSLGYVIVEKNAALSEHLHYDESYVEGVTESAKTTLAHLEPFAAGNGFIFQLRNGHFIINDGGHSENIPYMLDYMTARIPEGEKPVVEAWMISHAHDDHAALFHEFTENPVLADKLYVEGVYFTMLSTKELDEMKEGAVDSVSLSIWTATNKALKTTKGEAPKMYRPLPGQRYYFCDITVDVVSSYENIPRERWFRTTGNYNDLSTCFTYNIGEQKVFIGGDADYGTMKFIMSTYDQEYMKMDVASVLHHGINVYNDWSDWCEVKTALYTYYGDLGVFKPDLNWGAAYQEQIKENEYLHTKVQETLHYGDGTKVLTFPYVVGTAETLPIRGERRKIDSEYYIIYDNMAPYQ